MLETNPGQSARQVHLALKSAPRKMAEAEKCAVICLGEIMARKLYRELGYSSINHYAEAELGFSARRTRDFVALSRKLATLLPVPRQAPAVVVPADQVETLLAVMQSFTEARGPRGPENQATQPPAQIHIHHCEECGKASVQTSRGELAIGAAELAQAQCDCQVSRPEQRNTTSIPPATRRRVLAAARHKCQRPGCDHTHYLEVHHKVPRSHGGANDPENLICLCSAGLQLELRDDRCPHGRKRRGTPSLPHDCRLPQNVLQ